MKILYETSFKKDLKKISETKIKTKLKELLINIKNSKSLSSIPKLKKIQGYKSFYRIRLENYRIGIEVVANTIYFVRILLRKDIYKFFP